jgi:predicted NAD/FAD-dependent oxidoreductase
MKIAIIGAGLSGCNSYKILSKIENIQITVFDKSRGAGGRLSTKYIEDKFIDHGTAFIKTKNPDLKLFLDKKVEDDILIKDRNQYLPKNGINKLCSRLINKKDLITNSRIEKISYINNKWILEDQSKEYSNYDVLILTIPTKQILELDMKINKKMKNKLEQVTYKSIASLICYSYLNQKLDLKKIENSKVIFKAFDNSKKYNYKDFSSYILHFDNSFIEQNEDLDKDDLFEVIHKKIESDFDLNIRNEFETIEHYWKYALVNKNINEDFLLDKEYKLGFCGDYFIGKNIESSLTSSCKLAKKIKELLC